MIIKDILGKDHEIDISRITKLGGGEIVFDPNDAGGSGKARRGSMTPASVTVNGKTITIPQEESSRIFQVLKDAENTA